MSGRDRDESGQFQPEVSDSEMLAGVEANHPGGTREIADAVDLARQHADYRLRNLRDQGRVASNKVGRPLVWTDDGSLVWTLSDGSF